MQTQLLVSSLILPLYMTMGVVFWILLLVLLVIQPFTFRTAKQQKKNDASQEYTNRLNKRFDQADALEDDEHVSRTSEESLMKRSNKNLVKTREVSSSGMYFKNVETSSFLFVNGPYHFRMGLR